MGFECDGPLEGDIFIDMTPRYTKKEDEAGQRQESEISPVKLLVPSVKDFEDICINQFHDAMTSQRPPKITTWLAYLRQPAYLSSYPALAPALRAASMMLYGISHRDACARTEAHDWYERSLTSHRHQLQKLSADLQGPISNLVSCSLVLALFEMISSTVPNGPTHHYSAAAVLLRGVGPSSCRGGIMHQMFRTARLNDAYISIMTGIQSPFATEEWLTVPFAEYPKTAVDSIVDILLLTTHCTHLLSNVTDSMESRRLINWDAPDMRIIKRLALSLVESSDDWLCEHEVREARLLEGSEGASARRDFVPNHEGGRYLGTLSATLWGLHSTVNMILYSVLLASTPSSDPARHEYQRRVFFHSSKILSVAAYQEAARLAGGDFIRTAYPVKVVVGLSPSTEHRRRAEATLVRWAQLSSLTCLCTAFHIPAYLQAEAPR
ncbi:uncharacterized protein PV07_10395 [Cladophialophora immunda]|uniref:Transcription factor domain-containing protein n=1 Tax=Cladophialophora immunda TaxID=569365 RepID=A0A0D2CMC1_9EURO|nr:uncharacterized protein PV07_10395 [Cladophialophora immunda]KIW24694.1 hypothetical protein PV07_10395 [Cladophialophora immunda]